MDIAHSIHLKRKLRWVAASWLGISLTIYANPEGGQVVGGQATISSQSGYMQINQTTNQAIIEWQKFNIQVNEHTHFSQPSNTAATLNRINALNGVSQIMGRLTANGHIYLINPAGILFGKTASIDVAGLVATTANISNENFMARHYEFFQSPLYPNSSIINEGLISIKDGGLAALVAPGVRNAGIIHANLGKVALGSGTHFTLDLYGDELIHFALDGAIASKPKDAYGQPMASAVENTGSIYANGGSVQLTTHAVKGVVDNAINTTGLINASRVKQVGGKIILDGGQANAVKVSGSVKATGTRGGQIHVKGNDIKINEATIDVSGTEGGGEVRIGGKPQTETLAENTYIGPDTLILANAISNGNGGTVIVWANTNTDFIGRIEAKGGTQSGNGGFVETSALGSINYANGRVYANSPYGQAGTWLVDPSNETIDQVRANTIVATLNGLTNFVLETSNVGVGEGDITFLNNVLLSWTTNAQLSIKAHDDVIFNNGATITNNGLGHLFIRTDVDGNNDGTPVFNGFGQGIGGTHIDVGSATIHYNPIVYPTSDDFSSHITTVNLFEQFMLVNDVDRLQQINANESGNYVLGKDIDATATQTWNFQGSIFTGFSPIPSFLGFLDGNNHTIDGLYINRLSNTGIFATMFSATVQNLHLTNLQVSGTDLVGGVAGYAFDSLITNVSTQGQIIGRDHVGGLIGLGEDINIANSENNTTVSGEFYIGGIAGGLNGTDATALNNVNRGIINGIESVGGIVGSLTASVSTLNSNDNHGAITASNENAGGIAGYILTGGIQVSNNHNFNLATITSPIDAGGIIGLLEIINPNATYTITNNSNEAGISVPTNGGGIIGRVNHDLSVLSVDSSGEVNISFNFNQGSVNGGIGSVNSGGIIGQYFHALYVPSDITTQHSINIQHNQNDEEIFGTTNTGGIIGLFYHYLTLNNENLSDNSSISEHIISITENTNNGFVNSASPVGGIVGRFQDYMDISSFSIFSGAPISEHTITLSDNLNTASVWGSESIGGILGLYDSTISISTTLISATPQINHSIMLNSNINKGNLLGFIYKGGTIGRYVQFIDGGNNSIISHDVSIQENINHGTIEGSQTQGGILGRLESSILNSDILDYTIDITQNLNTGLIKAYDHTAGGIVGSVIGGDNFVNLFYNINLGNISGSSVSGGLIGFAQGINIFHNYSIGSVTLTFGNGSLVGFRDLNVIFSGTNYWNDDTESELDGIGGGQPPFEAGQYLPLDTIQMQIESSFVGWDFINIWGIFDNISYPYLRSIFTSPLQIISGIVSNTSTNSVTPSDVLGQVHLFSNGELLTKASVYDNGTFYIAHDQWTIDSGDTFLASSVNVNDVTDGNILGNYIGIIFLSLGAPNEVNIKPNAVVIDTNGGQILHSDVVVLNPNNEFSEIYFQSTSSNSLKINSSFDLLIKGQLNYVLNGTLSAQGNPITITAPLFIVDNDNLLEQVTSGNFHLSTDIKGFASLNVKGGQGDNTLFLEIDGFSSSVFPYPGILFNGGGIGDFDTLALFDSNLNYSPSTIVHNFTNASAGNVVIDAMPTVTYLGLEPIVDNLPSIDRTFNFNGLANDITLSDGPLSSDNYMRITSPDSETVDFVIPDFALIINGGAGDDNVYIDSVDSFFHSTIPIRTLTVNGQAGQNTLELGTSLNYTHLIIDGTSTQVFGDISVYRLTNFGPLVLNDVNHHFYINSVYNLFGNISGPGAALHIHHNPTSPESPLVVNPTANVNLRSLYIDSNVHWFQSVDENPLVNVLPILNVSSDFAILDSSTSTFRRFAGGLGTLANPYQLVDVFGLQGLTSHSLLTNHFILNNDINAFSTFLWNGFMGFVPIGLLGDALNSSLLLPINKVFEGSLDGNNHTINNLYINRPNSSGIGLFAINAGTIKNLGMIDSIIIGQRRVGGITGVNRNIIDNVFNTGTVRGFESVGGIAGWQVKGTISNSHNSGAISTDPLLDIGSPSFAANYVGGIIGLIYSFNEPLITVVSSHLVNVSNEGPITNPTGSVSGGLVGGNFYGNQLAVNFSISNSFNTGPIQVQKQGVAFPASTGGIIGFTFTGTFSNVHNFGDITANNGVFVGGILGYTPNFVDINNSHNSGNISHSFLYTGGIVGYFGGGFIDSTYNAGNIEGNPGSDVIGGIVGYGSGPIIKSYNVGNISGDNYLGGIAGYFSIGNISNSFNLGNVIGNDRLGGIAGYSSGDVFNTYTIGYIKGNSNVGGILGDGVIGIFFDNFWNSATSGLINGIGSMGPNEMIGRYESRTTAQMMMKSTFTTEGWDFSNGGVWDINEGISFPYHQWRYPTPPQTISGIVYDATNNPVEPLNVVSLYHNNELFDNRQTYANGFYYSLLDNSTIPAGDVFLSIYGDGTTKANTFGLTDGSAVNVTGALFTNIGITNADLYHNLVNIVTHNGSTVNHSEIIQTATGNNNPNRLFETMSNALILYPQVHFYTQPNAPYFLNGVLSAQGGVITFDSALITDAFGLSILTQATDGVFNIFGPLQGLGTLGVFGGIGNNILNINFEGGNSLPLGGIVYSGNGFGDFDSLILDNGNFISVDYDFTSPFDGSIQFNGEPQLIYTGLEPISDGLVVFNRNFIFNNNLTNETLIFDKAQTIGFNIIDSNVSEFVNFRNPINGLGIQSQTGNDIIHIQGIDPTFNGFLDINGGPGNDTIIYAINRPILGRIDGRGGHDILITIPFIETFTILDVGSIDGTTGVIPNLIGIFDNIDNDTKLQEEVDGLFRAERSRQTDETMGDDKAQQNMCAAIANGVVNVSADTNDSCGTEMNVFELPLTLND